MLWFSSFFYMIFCFILKQKCEINALLLKQLFRLIITLFLRWPLITENNTFVTWPATVKCDLQLSNLQHAVGYSKDGVFKFRFPELYHSKKGLFVKQLMQFCFKETCFVDFFTDPELSNLLYQNITCARKILRSQNS